jgi:hypothetical protein
MSTPWPASATRAAFRPYFSELGKHPFEADGTLWFESGPGFYQAFPFHQVMPLGRPALEPIFEHRRVVAARFASAPRQTETPSRSVLWIRRTPYALDELSANARSKARRGLKATTIDRLDFITLRRLGLDLVASTAARQRVRFGDRQAGAFRRVCEVAVHHHQIEAYGAFVGSRLAAFALCFQVEDCFQISTVRSDSAHLKSYPNNALIHSLMASAWDRPGVDAVCYGLASLDRGTAGLDDFKRSAGFDGEAIDDVIVARFPILAARAAATVFERVRPGSHRAAQYATIARTAAWWRHADHPTSKAGAGR